MNITTARVRQQDKKMIPEKFVGYAHGFAKMTNLQK